MRHETINNHPYVIPSFHTGDDPFGFFESSKFFLPENSSIFLLLCIFTLDAQHWLSHSSFLTFVLQTFFLYHSYCLLCTLDFLPSIKHAIFVQFYKHLKFQKCPIFLMNFFNNRNFPFHCARQRITPSWTLKISMDFDTFGLFFFQGWFNIFMVIVLVEFQLGV